MEKISGKKQMYDIYKHRDRCWVVIHVLCIFPFLYCFGLSSFDDAEHRKIDPPLRDMTFFR